MTDLEQQIIGQLDEIRNLRGISPGSNLEVNDLTVDGILTGNGSNLTNLPDSGLIDILATEDLPAFVVVTVDGHRANSSNTAHNGRVVGIIPSAIANGFVGQVRELGELTNPSWSWTPNTVLFLNGTAISAVAPSAGFVQQIGLARTSQKLVVNLGPPILL